MATPETDRFTSRFRRARKEFENDAADSKEGKESSMTISTSSSSRVAARCAVTRAEREKDRDEGSVSSAVSRINRLNLKDKENEEVDSGTSKEIHDDHDDDETDKKKGNKKERGGASGTSARKRQARRNLREKRRSTGVVIMPKMEDDNEVDGETKALKDNTAQNEHLEDMSQTKGKSRSKGGDELDRIEKQQLLEQLEAYEQAVLEWRDELEKAHKEIDQLKNDNQRLRDENTALLRLVNQLSASASRK